MWKMPFGIQLVQKKHAGELTPKAGGMDTSQIWAQAR